MAELLISFPDGRTLRRQLSTAAVTIGRDAACEIPTDDPSTSRRHARIAPSPSGYQVEDLRSKNGTLVNEQPCTAPILLKHGDVVLLGATVVRYEDIPVKSHGSVIVADDVTKSHATHYVAKDQRLALSQRRLEMIYELSEQLTTLQSRDQLLETAMTTCFQTLHFERGAVGVRRRNQRTVDWPVVRNLRGAEGELTISRTLLGRALDHGERAIYTDEGPGYADPTVSMVQQGIRSAMCVPLMHGDQILGVIYGDRLSTSTRYTNEDIDFFAAIARQVSIGLINCELLEEQRRMIQLHHDIEVARGIQTGLFPSALPNRADLRVAALNEPGRRISGDYYDVVERDDGRLWLLVADVTGEGVAAAMQMANFQAAVRVTVGETDDPGELLTRWNRFICRNSTASRFITCVLALLDPKSRRLRVGSAGHFAPLLLRPGGPGPAELPVDAGFPLGVEEEATFACTEHEMGRDPYLLFCYTDGVTEAFNGDGHAFGHDRLVKTLREHSEMNPQAMVKQVRKQVSTFVGPAEQSDDITLLAAWMS